MITTGCLQIVGCLGRHAKTIACFSYWILCVPSWGNRVDYQMKVTESARAPWMASKNKNVKTCGCVIELVKYVPKNSPY